ncbi:MAG: BatD family protein [Verrucomicrobia bacterium]|nr:BatD family protein [Verrucomicrobiota bacterium]
MRRLLALLFFAALALTAARAQSVRWESADSGDPSDLQLIFQDCAPDGEIRLPATPGLTLVQTGTSTQMSIVNFSTTRSVVVSYSARAQQGRTQVNIPAFSVSTNRGTIKVPAYVGGTPRAVSDYGISSSLVPGSLRVWAGEVFPLTYMLDLGRNPSRPATNVDWSAAPLITEDWANPEPAEFTANGEARSGFAWHARAYAKTAGPLTLNPANILVNVQTGSVNMGIFQSPRIEQLPVVSNRPSIIVNPLPPAPAGFSGAVGQFKFTSKVVPATAGPGEPITWTVELSGTGNWPDIAGLPQRDVSKDFQVIQPKARRTPAEGKLFDVTLSEDVVLVPTRPGTYDLGPLRFTYFDPKAGAYKTLTTPRTTVTITAPAAAPATGPQPAASGPAAPAETAAPAAPKPAPTPAALPSGLPRDPLAGTAVTSAPSSLRAVLAWAIVPFAALGLFWAWLALRRARATDPLLARREARIRIADTVKKLGAAPASRELLLAWQHDTAVLWQLAHAAPPAASLPDPAWAALWAETDRALYGPEAMLPADWTARAQSALAAKALPPFSPVQLFLPRNLLPFFFAVGFLLILAVPAVRAATPEAAYRSGDFAAAEKGWREALAAQPHDAIARYNLSLALAQQDRWGEAAAYAAGAFVHDPAADPIRWQLALTMEKAGFAPGPLGAFVTPGPEQSLARLASPACWQYGLILAAGLVALGLALLLLGAYRGPSRPRLVLALIALLAGLLLSAAALASLHAYGDTTRANAVIVWRDGLLRSIPTEADTTQKTTTLAPGSLALADRTFLGWTRLTFANGQTGWVRTEEVIPLWR